MAIESNLKNKRCFRHRHTHSAENNDISRSYVAGSNNAHLRDNSLSQLSNAFCLLFLFAHAARLGFFYKTRYINPQVL